MTPKTSRRSFLKGAAASGAVLAIGFDAEGILAAEGNAGGAITPFVTIADDGTVTAIIKHLEGGQGTATGLSALIAEEMNMRLQDIQFATAPADAERYKNLFFGSQATGGSTSMANSFMQYRTAGAAAREMLLQAAADSWDVPVDQLTLADGVISGAGMSGGIGEFATAAARIQVPAEPQLKAPADWTVIGIDQKSRRDTADKINGQAQYAMDVQLDGMMVVAIKRSPRMGGLVASFDDAAAKDVPGFIMAATLPNNAGVAAYAENTWAAFQARDALEVTWDDSAAETRSSEQIREQLLAAVREEPEFDALPTDRTATLASIDDAKTVVEHEFYFPMLAHAPMEPLTATIEPQPDGGVIVHDGAQSPTSDQMVVHNVLQIPMDKIKVNSLYAGGFFGRRSNPDADYIVELALAFAMTDRSRPVKLVWSREDDITGGYYRPAIAHRVRVGLDDGGRIVGWEHHIACQSLFKGTIFESFIVKDGVDHTSVEGVVGTPYAIPGMHVGLTDATPATTVSWWRSVGSSHTGYVMESMMDAAATAAGADPVAFRMDYLSDDNPDQRRMAATLSLAAEKADWGSALPEGRSRGVAVHKSFGSYVAEVCEISTDADGVVRIEKFTAAVDCGIAVTPDVVRAQIEGGIGYGVGHVMRDKITLEDGAIYELNFPDYEPLRMRDIGAIDVHIVASAENPTGVGEPGTPPAGPALANAIAVKGPRVTVLPMTDSGIEFA